MKFKFEKPITVGDLNNSIVIDELEVESLSITFDPETPVLSIVLLHRASGWQHNVVCSDSSAVEFWAKTYEAEFDFLHKIWLEKLVADSKLPLGALVK